MASATGCSIKDIEVMKRERTHLRKLLTKACGAYDEATNKEPLDILELQMKMTQLEDKGERLFSLDRKIMEVIYSVSEEISDDDLEKEIDSVDVYRNRILERKTKHENLMMAERSGSTRESPEVANMAVNDKRNFRLPKLELKQFDGDVRSWIGFWGQFRKIHDDSSLDSEDKFQYLLQATKVGSCARELVESFPPSKENYTKAIDQLKARFAKDEFLIEVYVRELLNLVLKQAAKNKGTMSLSKLFDKLETQLRALESLGVTSDKYAAMLFPLVESALPEEILKAWERHRSSRRESPGERHSRNPDQLQWLLDFLRAEVESEERLLLARSGFANGERITPKVKGIANELPTAATLMIGNKAKDAECVFCEKRSHRSQDCCRASEMTLSERKDRLSKKNCCYNCLKVGHKARVCRFLLRCLICASSHHVVMCPELKEKTVKVPEKITPRGHVLHTQSREAETSLLTILVNIVVQERTKLVRALLDTGSQKSYIAKDVVKELGLQKVGEEEFVQCTFGGVESPPVIRSRYEITVQSTAGDFECEIPVIEQERICNFVPRMNCQDCLKQLRRKNVVLADVGKEDIGIGLLLGADVLGYILTGTVEQLEDGVVAIKSRLGWTLMGSHLGQCRSVASLPCMTSTGSMRDLWDSGIRSAKKSPKATCIFNCMCSKGTAISDFWNLETLGIRDPAEVRSAQEKHRDALIHFKKTVCRNDEGRYEVKLPWLEGHPALPTNRKLAEKRLRSVTKRLQSEKKLKLYQQVIDEWCAEGVIEAVQNEGPEQNVHYLPHHPVYKETSATTKVRPVFDASSKEKKCPSLNDCLDKGPNLIETIPDLLLRFRLKGIGVVSDIKRAFLQIGLSIEDRDFMRFLWWTDESCEVVTSFRHCRVVFGVSPSPFLLNATITHHLENAPNKYRSTVERLKGSFYVDDCVTSVKDEQELGTFVTEAQEVMALTKFELRGWTYGGLSLNSNVTENWGHLTQNITSVLGLLWHTNEDLLSCDMRGISEAQWDPTTKRELLSVTQSF